MKHLFCLLGLFAAILSIPPPQARADEENGGTNTSLWDSTSRKSTVTLYMRYNGPALGQPWGESYNVFTRSPWPMQVFSSLNFEYHLDPAYSVGFGTSAAKGLVPGVKGSRGADVDIGWFFFDPSVFVQKNNLIDNTYLNVAGQLRVFIPSSSFEWDQTMILWLALDQTWTLKGINGPWIGGFNTRFKPTFYRQSVSANPSDLKREILSYSIGHFLKYSLSGKFQLTTSSKFNSGLLAGNDPAFIHDPIIDDYAEAGLNYFPATNGTRIGVYALSPVFDARLQKAILGFDFTLPI